MAAPGVPQIHDYNPGIAPSGLFWTIRLPEKAVTVDKAAANASYAMKDLTLYDHLNVGNALIGGPADRALCSFDVRWKATGKPMTIRDDANKFVGEFRMATSTIEWESRGSGFSFKSDPADTSSTVFAMIGKERNGEFFS